MNVYEHITWHWLERWPEDDHLTWADIRATVAARIRRLGERIC